MPVTPAGGGNPVAPATAAPHTNTFPKPTVILWDVGGVINDGNRFWQKRADLAKQFASYGVTLVKLVAYSDHHRPEVDLGTMGEFAFWHNALVFAGVAESDLAKFPTIGETNPYVVPEALRSNPQTVTDFTNLNGQKTYADIMPYIEPIPGTIDLMRDLQKAGVRQGILSNDSIELGRLKRWKLYDHLVDDNLFFLSAKIAVKKPGLKIYHEALQRSGMIEKAGQVVFIDDKEENCAAARNAGMQAILFKNPDRLREALNRMFAPPVDPQVSMVRSTPFEFDTDYKTDCVKGLYPVGPPTQYQWTLDLRNYYWLNQQGQSTTFYSEFWSRGQNRGVVPPTFQGDRVLAVRRIQMLGTNGDNNKWFDCEQKFGFPGIMVTTGACEMASGPIQSSEDWPLQSGDQTGWQLMNTLFHGAAATILPQKPKNYDDVIYTSLPGPYASRIKGKYPDDSDSCQGEFGTKQDIEYSPTPRGILDADHSANFARQDYCVRLVEDTTLLLQFPLRNNEITPGRKFTVYHDRANPDKVHVQEGNSFERDAALIAVQFEVVPTAHAKPSL